jgi:hypothetical protein
MIPGGPFNNTNFPVFSNRLDRKVALNSQSLTPATQGYVASSKFLGYAVVGPPTNSVNVSKFLGYAVITDTPLLPRKFLEEWPNPLRPKRLPDYTWIYYPPPDLIPVPPLPVGDTSLSIPQNNRRLKDYSWTNVAFHGTISLPPGKTYTEFNYQLKRWPLYEEQYIPQQILIGGIRGWLFST